MGRMHSNGKGKSRSALPYKRTSPSWLKVTSGEVRRRAAYAGAGGVAPACKAGGPLPLPLARPLLLPRPLPSCCSSAAACRWAT